MVLKWISLGFYGRYKSVWKNGLYFEKGDPDYAGYFNDHWNTLDFVIVLVSFTIFIPDADSNISAIRSLRVLRPLRSLSEGTMRVKNWIPNLVKIILFFVSVS